MAVRRGHWRASQEAAGGGGGPRSDRGGAGSPAATAAGAPVHSRPRGARPRAAASRAGAAGWGTKGSGAPSGPRPRNGKVQEDIREAGDPHWKRCQRYFTKFMLKSQRPELEEYETEGEMNTSHQPDGGILSLAGKFLSSTSPSLNIYRSCSILNI